MATAEKIQLHAIGGYRANSAFLEGHAAVHWNGTGATNKDVCLPNNADALNGGRCFVGVWPNAGTAVAYPGTSTQGWDVGAPIQLGRAPVLLKANNAAVKGGPVGYLPSDGGLFVPYTSVSQVFVGHFAESASSSASNQLVSVDLAGPVSGNMGSGLRLYGIVADGTHTANVDTQQTFSTGTYAIPANLLQAGQVIRIVGQALVENQNGTDKLVLRVKVGSNTIVATPSTYDPATNDVINFTAEIKLRTVGAAGTMVADGLLIFGVAAGTMAQGSLAETAVDTTAAVTVSTSVQFDAASASNVCKLRKWDVYLL